MNKPTINLDVAQLLIEKGISLIPYTYNIEKKKKIPWDSWRIPILPVTTIEQLIQCAKQDHCDGFQFRPGDANMVVIDIDNKSIDGFKNFNYLLKEYGIKSLSTLETGFMVKTPNNGMHLYAISDEQSNYTYKGIIEGVDIFGSDEGLIILPGSRAPNESGEWKIYEHLGHINNIQVIPKDISNMLVNIKNKKEQEKIKKQEEKRLLQQARILGFNGFSNDVFTDAKNRVTPNLITSYFESKGSYWDNDEFFTLSPLRNDRNVGSFHINTRGDYYDHATEQGGDFINLLSNALGITLYESALRIIKDTGGDTDKYKTHILDDKVKSIIDKTDWNNIIDRQQNNTLKVTETVNINTNSTNILLEKYQVSFCDDLPSEYTPPDEIIQDMFTSKSVAVIYGDSNSGKTFFAISLAAALSEGIECYGKKTDKGLVVYLAVEAPGSVKARLQALKKYYNKNFSNIAIIPVPINFYSNNGQCIELIETIKEIERIKGQKIKMVIGDTLARMASGANENSGEDMAPVMEKFSLVAEQTGACALIIHHNGKDQAKGSRGWSGIRAHIDTEIEVSDNEGKRTAKITKQRDLSSKNDTINFTLQTVEMGVTKFGSKAISCVAVPDVNNYETIESSPNLKSHSYRNDLINAWLYSSMDEDIDGRPCITTDELTEFLVEEKGIKESSAVQMVKVSSKGRWINMLNEAGDISKIGDTVIVKNTSLILKMNILKQKMIDDGEVDNSVTKRNKMVTKRNSHPP